MKSKKKSESNIPPTGIKTNVKKKVKSPAGFDLGGSLLKMNEFTLIIVGALVVTVLVFFLFFRSPDPDERNTPPKTPAKPVSVATDPRIEQRIADLEVSVSRLASSTSLAEAGASGGKPQAVTRLNQRVTRLERALTLKLDALMARLGKMEKQVAALKKRPVVSKPAVPKPKSPISTASKSTAPNPEVSMPAPKSPKPAVKKLKPIPLKKKAVQNSKKNVKEKNIFHTVKKGETLWSISQKYKTTVGAVRKLNNMTDKDTIYPGSNLIVR